MKLKPLNHIFVDVENSAGLEVDCLENFMKNSDVKFSQRIAFISKNTPQHLSSKWQNSNFQIAKAGSNPRCRRFLLERQDYFASNSRQKGEAS